MKSYQNNIIAVLFIITAFAIQSCEKEVYVEPTPEKDINYARVYVDSNPAGATIYINGKTTGLVTPDTVKWITTGDYQITLKKKYFWDTTFTVSAINNKTITGYVDYYQSERMLGRISCTSNPAGAKIYLDNIYTGKATPALLTRLLPQIHSVKYEYPEYRKDSADVVVKSSSVVSCGMTLEDTLDVVTYNKINSGLPSNDITCLVEDNKGNMWFGTSTEGLLKFDGKKFYRYTVENMNEIPSNYVRKIVRDKDNNLWIGFSNGIVRYDGVNWTTFQTNMVTSLKVCQENTILAATYRGGLFKYSMGNAERIRASQNGLSKDDLSSAYIEKSGILWAGLSTGGIDQLSGTVWKSLSSESGDIPLKHNSALECDTDGTLFGIFHDAFDAQASVQHVFSIYTGGKWNNIYSASSTFNYDNIYVDNKNTVWFGFGGAIFRVYNKSSLYSLPRLIHSDVRRLRGNDLTIYTNGIEVYADSKSNLWIIGNTKGIIKIKAGRWDY